jgi:GxxExxY protein
MNTSNLDQLAERVIGAAIEVHRALGPGLLESAYRIAVCHELSSLSIPFETEKPLPVQYKGALLDCGYRLDVVIASTIVLELKAVETLLPIHQAQLLSYLKLGSYSLGYLINFHERLLKHGIKRLILDPSPCSP